MQNTDVKKKETNRSVKSIKWLYAHICNFRNMGEKVLLANEKEQYQKGSW